MHYVAIVDGKEVQVEISEPAPNMYLLSWDGMQMEVDARSVEEAALSMQIGTQIFDAKIEDAGNGGVEVALDGDLFSGEVLDLRTVNLRRAQAEVAGPDGPQEVRAPMPGRVVSILVAEGDEVAEGTPLVVLEAMKMENELRAPKAGIVESLNLESGQNVEGDAVLCVVA